MSPQEPANFTFMLKLWREEHDHNHIWRASLERPGRGETCIFRGLEEMCEFIYLTAQTQSDDCPCEEELADLLAA